MSRFHLASFQISITGKKEMNKSYDLIICGAGSIGVPAAMEFARDGQSVLVIDSSPSPGQGENKKAIGGIRGTHSNKGKILVGLRSIEIFSCWKEMYGDDIDWKSIGYSFPAYSEEYENTLKDLMKIQKSFGLNIGWVTPEEYRELTPEIKMEGLRGSTYSPEDGYASPLIFIQSAYFKAVEYGAEFNFNEAVVGFDIEANRIVSVKTDRGVYHSANVLNAAGSFAKEISRMADIDIPVRPKSLEAAISEPVKPFMGPMVVDMESDPNTRNLSFYQNSEGQVLFSLSPYPPMWGTDSRSTSSFLPVVARQVIRIMPILANLKVRRTWRGLTPMTPDSFPLVGKMKELDNFYQAVGMCGQGFMMGPGIAELLCRMITGNHHSNDEEILKSFDPYRDFEGQEVL